MKEKTIKTFALFLLFILILINSFISYTILSSIITGNLPDDGAIGYFIIAPPILAFNIGLIISFIFILKNINK
uniref:DUF3955 domain-containing protein n=1 Tax=candidate division CPR3 bacterium TaxID=2268181 RepID=A0A7C4R252_UNCC3